MFTAHQVSEFIYSAIPVVFFVIVLTFLATILAYFISLTIWLIKNDWSR